MFRKVFVTFGLTLIIAGCATPFSEKQQPEGNTERVPAAGGQVQDGAISKSENKIVLQFNGPDGDGETVYVPSRGAFIDLVNLSSDGLEDYPCYIGSATIVLKQLNKLVQEAGANVRRYRAELQEKTIVMEIHMKNALGEVQKMNHSIERCKNR